MNGPELFITLLSGALTMEADSTGFDQQPDVVQPSLEVMPIAAYAAAAADDDFDPLPPTEPGQRFRPGDVNNDGRINQADVEATVRILLGGNTTGLVRAAADLNGDNKITVTDLVCIIKKL